LKIRRALRGFLILLIVAGALLICGGVYARWRLGGSLPQLGGTASIRGLAGDVRVERDGLGTPTIHAGNREDLARALGFLHAQDRFFQMDLQRRQPAGELSALVGARALDVDQEVRVHRFRAIARRAVALADPAYRRILEAYADGVNAGVNALGTAPFEYHVLNATPQPWLPEDTILTVLAMFNTLQGRQASFERGHGAIRDTMPEPMFKFLSTVGSEWETPVVGPPVARPPIPGPEIFDLRKGTTEALSAVEGWHIEDPDEASIIGSNNWAVDAAHTANGGALLANDMHLTIAVPILWYRASFSLNGERLTGLTLPGIPSLVVGSNGHVAWGFTNTGGDWSDLVRIEPDPRDPANYLTPDGPKPFEVFQETIAAAGATSRTSIVRWTIWGPIVWKDARGREYAQKWVAHDAAALAADTTKPERAQTVDELIAAVAGLGIPNQNVTIADSNGRIGWTIGGVIPRRIGHDGRTPESWADGTHRWDGYLPPADYPRIVDPSDGRIWTANSPVVGGDMLAAIGEGGYADGIRARLIRDRLMGLEKATARDMLDIQLEDKALFLERWRQVVLDSVDEQGTTAQMRAFRNLVDTRWTGRASPDSIGYRLVKEFRTTMVRTVMEQLTASARQVDPAFEYTSLQRGEGPVWQLVSERPPHLLGPKSGSWRLAILEAVQTAYARLAIDTTDPSQQTWGTVNKADFRHPLAGAIPWFGRLLNMPADPLPGDVFTPRASSPRTGPSQRMVVSPGREHEGILHLPTGQSGHPLSPHYGDQYRAWLNGEPTPLLPGATVATLTLVPQP